MKETYNNNHTFEFNPLKLIEQIIYEGNLAIKFCNNNKATNSINSQTIKRIEELLNVSKENETNQ